MSQPIYFLPSVAAGQVCDPHLGKLNIKVLKAHGLDEIFADIRDKEECSIFDGSGPGGLHGCFICYQTLNGELPQRLGYFSANQEWTHVGKVWIGVDHDSPPTAADICRKRAFSGYSIELGNGERWKVPIIRRPDDSTELPCDLYYGDDGTLKEPVISAYEKYWEETAAVAGWFFSRDFSAMTKAVAFPLAVRALSLNYRFGHGEQRVMRLIDSTNYLTILAATVDFPRVQAVEASEKKRASTGDTLTTTPGAVAA